MTIMAKKLLYIISILLYLKFHSLVGLVHDRDWMMPDGKLYLHSQDSKDTQSPALRCTIINLYSLLQWQYSHRPIECEGSANLVSIDYFHQNKPYADEISKWTLLL